jgi:2-polyprenyl-6-methoxyphenol hydroxylase-like FAD-dependent oxidoreductase
MTVVPDHVPVLVVGGGPSGLAAAIELGRRGIDVLVVEPRSALDPLRPRAKTTSVRTREHVRRWGTFGLVSVDRTTFARTPKPSLAWLGEVARRNGLA